MITSYLYVDINIPILFSTKHLSISPVCRTSSSKVNIRLRSSLHSSIHLDQPTLTQFKYTIDQ